MTEPRRILELDDPAWAELTTGMRELRAHGPSDCELARMRDALTATHAPRHEFRRFRRIGPPLAAAGAMVAGAVALILWSRPGHVPPRVAPAPGPAPLEVREPVPPPANVPTPVPVPPATQTPARARETSPPRPLTSRRSAATTMGELKLLRLAKAHARSNPPRALALVAEHERQFAGGGLAQEREVIAIEALLCAGERQRAELRAAKFQAQFPSSAHGRRIQTLLAPRHDSDAKSTTTPHASDR